QERRLGRSLLLGGDARIARPGGRAAPAALPDRAGLHVLDHRSAEHRARQRGRHAMTRPDDTSRDNAARDEVARRNTTPDDAAREDLARRDRARPDAKSAASNPAPGADKRAEIPPVS